MYLGQYCRLDHHNFSKLITNNVIIKYLSIEYYFKHKAFPLLYFKFLHSFMKDRTKPNMLKREKRFISLIQSFEMNHQFNENSPIYVDEDFMLLNGNHRVACCLYFNIPYLYYRIVNRKKQPLNYLKFNKLNKKLMEALTPHEILEIERKKEEILHSMTVKTNMK